MSMQEVLQIPGIGIWHSVHSKLTDLHVHVHVWSPQ